MSIGMKIIFLVLVLALEQGDAYGKVCYPTYEKSCFSPDYYIHWTGAQCMYGSRGGTGECWALEWYMLWIYAAVGLPIGMGILGCLCGPLCGSDFIAGCLGGSSAGYCFTCPCCALPCFYYVFFSKIRCELCGEDFKSCVFKGLSQGYSHKKSCLERNGSEYKNIPESSLYSCKTCQTNLKLWPREKLEKSSCTKCEEEIVNNGTNLHVCFTCISDGTQKGSCKSTVINLDHWTNHHLCSRHTREGNMIEIDFEDLEHMPLAYASDTEIMPIVQSAPSQSKNALPPGWQLLTNPVTGEPYGLCDPSGEIRPLGNNSIPPPYAEAIANPSGEPLLAVTTWNEHEMSNMGPANKKT